MFGLSAIPAAIQGVGMFFLPKSPRFLALTGKDAEVRISIYYMHKCVSYECKSSEEKKHVVFLKIQCVIDCILLFVKS